MKKKDITINNHIEHTGIIVKAVSFANSFFAFTKTDTTFQPQDGNKRLSVNITDAPFPFYSMGSTISHRVKKYTEIKRHITETNVIILKGSTNFPFTISYRSFSSIVTTLSSMISYIGQKADVKLDFDKFNLINKFKLNLEKVVDNLARVYYFGRLSTQQSVANSSFSHEHSKD